MGLALILAPQEARVVGQNETDFSLDLYITLIYEITIYISFTSWIDKIESYQARSLVERQFPKPYN